MEDQYIVARIEHDDPTLKELWIVNDQSSLSMFDGHEMGALDASNYSIADVAKLNDAIMKNTHLDRISLDGGDSRVLIKGLRHNSYIKRLSICRCSSLCGASGSSILTSVSLTHCGIGNRCISGLPSFLKMCTNLSEITLSSCNIGAGIALEEIIKATRGHRQLTCLNLSENLLGTGGCQILAMNLPSQLRTLVLADNGINDDGAISLARCLGNSKLERLYLHDNSAFSARVWEAFSLLICNTVDANGIYASNHTLEDIVCRISLPSEVSALLKLNCDADKQQVAMAKILHHYAHFDATAFLESDLKMLPHIVNWFDRAQVCTKSSEDVNTKKLSTFYQFTKAMPLEFDQSRQTKSE